MEKRKGVDILIKAYRKYRADGGTRPLILAGKMQEDDIEQLLENALTEVEGLTYLGLYRIQQDMTCITTVLALCSHLWQKDLVCLY